MLRCWPAFEVSSTRRPFRVLVAHSPPQCQRTIRTCLCGIPTTEGTGPKVNRWRPNDVTLNIVYWIAIPSLRTLDLYPRVTSAPGDTESVASIGALNCYVGSSTHRFLESVLVSRDDLLRCAQAQQATETLLKYPRGFL